jgi:hypothetical protein
MTTMMRAIRLLRGVSLPCLLLLGTVALSADSVSGWRGNGTGLWPDARPPLEWHRVPRGALDGLRAAAAPPRGAGPGDAPLVAKGLLRDWLVAGPFAVDDSVTDFDRDCLGGETTAAPAEGQPAGTATWKTASVPPDDIMVFGTAQLPWLDLAQAVGFRRNQLAYAHAYLFSPRGGPVQLTAVTAAPCRGIAARAESPT